MVIDRKGFDNLLKRPWLNHEVSKQRVVLLKNERVEIIEGFVLVLVLVLVLVKIERGQMANGEV